MSVQLLVQLAVLKAPVDDGTKFTATTEYKVPIPLLGKLAESIIVKMNENEADVLLANLKARMET